MTISQTTFTAHETNVLVSLYPFHISSITTLCTDDMQLFLHHETRARMENELLSLTTTERKAEATDLLIRSGRLSERDADG
jgi:hypothetical protein